MSEQLRTCKVFKPQQRHYALWKTSWWQETGVISSYANSHYYAVIVGLPSKLLGGKRERESMKSKWSWLVTSPQVCQSCACVFKRLITNKQISTIREWMASQEIRALLSNPWKSFRNEKWSTDMTFSPEPKHTL